MNEANNVKRKLSNLINISTSENSDKWKEYHLGETRTHCYKCFKRNNKIYLKSQCPKLPDHEKCACYLIWLRKVAVGKATKRGNDGVDFYLVNLGFIPDYYITKQQAYDLGWRPELKNLWIIAPGKMIGGDLFNNREDKLPNSPGRIWYECDIDYNGGQRSKFRIVYSNDGLIFKTDDHYSRFIVVE